jgi:DNA-binding transcriptional regulator PaaX
VRPTRMTAGGPSVRSRLSVLLTESGRGALARFGRQHARTTRAEPVVWDGRWLLVRTTGEVANEFVRERYRRGQGAAASWWAEREPSK